MCGIWWNIVERVVGVYEAPVLDWRAVVIERVKLLKRGRVGIDPLAFAAVKVLKIDQSQRMIFTILQWMKVRTQ